MENTILELAKSQGLWAALFVFLLFWVLRENGKREGKYQDIIEKLTQKFESIEQGIEKLTDKVERWGK